MKQSNWDEHQTKEHKDYGLRPFPVPAGAVAGSIFRAKPNHFYYWCYIPHMYDLPLQRMLNKEHADAECWMLNRCVLTIFLFPWLNTSPGWIQSDWSEFRWQISDGKTESKKQASFMT